jgi:hypothetical protein
MVERLFDCRVEKSNTAAIQYNLINMKKRCATIIDLFNYVVG